MDKQKIISLEERFMSNKEVAEWGGITEAYFSKNRKSWCERVLSKYAEYELKRGYINITKVIDPIRNPKVKKQIEKNWDKCWGIEYFPVDTCKNAAKKMRPLIKFENEIQDNTFYNALCATKRDLFGVPKKRGGRWGSSYWIFCKVRIKDDVAVPFTNEEMDKKKELQKKYLSNNYEYYEEIKAARKALNRKEISKEDYAEAVGLIIDADKNWAKFETAFLTFINRDKEQYYLDYRTYIEQDGVLMLKDGAIEVEPLTEEQKAFFNS